MKTVLNKLDTLKRAKELLKSEDEMSLRYACLELRYCIEIIAYEFLNFFKKEIPESKYKNVWKPKEIILLLEEFEPNIQKDTAISIAPEGSNNFTVITKTKSLTTRFLMDHYNKIGSYLHAKPIDSRPIDTRRLQEYLKDVMNELDQYKLNGYSSIGTRILFNCPICGVQNSKLRNALEKNAVVTCINSKCEANNEVFLDSLEIKTRAINFDCPVCSAYIDVIKGTEFENKEVCCTQCLTNFKMYRGWYLDDGRK